MYMYTTSSTRWRIGIYGKRKNEETTFDRVELRRAQLQAVLHLLQKEISYIETRIGWRWREPWMTRHAFLVEILVTLDI